MNVIFIDDDEDLNFLQTRMCTRSKIVTHFFIASSGLQTLNYLSGNPVPPDVIFVDINMPVMSGFEFIEEFEKKFQTQFPDTLLYVVSSSVRSNDKKLAMQYKSVQDFIVKPLTEEKLEEIYYSMVKS